MFEGLRRGRELTDCKVAGWGLDNAGAMGRSRVARIARARTSRRWTGRAVRYGDAGGNRAASGDSGGGLACRIAGVWTLVGVHSRSQPRDGVFDHNLAAPATIPRELMEPFNAAVERARTGRQPVRSVRAREPSLLQRLEAAVKNWRDD